ncbi:hypothetical protein SO802_031475 [Lithocarpus litseifolius]|uniref:RNase H type-1 domain-containing protein n=1 Tax=Lithocarpus litseifolius TaxID=425828 RepID=A0AAW2BNX3_9ROSI
MAISRARESCAMRDERKKTRVLRERELRVRWRGGEERSAGRFPEQKSVAKDSVVSKDAKVNVDATYKDGGSSIAVVARDWRGEVVFACAKRVYTILPLQAEEEAIKWALSLAKRLEAAAMIVESDS